MDIRQLKYFLTITEEGGVTAAAKRLNMSQPPLSNQLKLLEEELGITLFERKNKRLILTKEGQLLYQHAKNLTTDFDYTLQMFHDLKSGITGTLSIGCICSPGIMFLPNMMKDFMKANPYVKLQICEDYSTELLHRLDSDEIELCILKEPFDHAVYESLPLDSLLGTEKDCLAAVALPQMFPISSTKLSFTDLEERPLIAQRNHKQLIIDACSKYGFAPKIICTHENVMTSLNWCLTGLGIAIMPHSSTKLAALLKQGDQLQVKELTNPQIESKTALVWKKRHILSPTARKFIDTIQLKRKIVNTFQREKIQ